MGEQVERNDGAKHDALRDRIAELEAECERLRCSERDHQQARQSETIRADRLDRECNAGASLNQQLAENFYLALLDRDALRDALRRVVEVFEADTDPEHWLPMLTYEMRAAIGEVAKLVKDDPTKGESHEHDTA